MTVETEREVAIPRRHRAFGEVASQRNPFGRALGMFSAELSESTWNALGACFMHGDPQADAIVHWMMAEGPPATRPMLERAVHGGVASVPSAPPVLRELFESIERRPPWFDAALFAEGARVCQLAGEAGFFVLRDGGLMPGYLATAINRTLILTGALQRGARRRMAETMKWWLDCTADGGMDPGKPGWNATLHVRFMHAFVRRRVQLMPEWKNEEWGIPVNQSDMAGTYLVFAITFLLGLRVVGVPITDQEGRAVVHFWKYVSWLMGVDERWLVDTEAEGRKLLWHVALGHTELHPNSAELGRALMNEPIERPYEDFAWLRGRFAREQHLSVTRLFVNGAQMHALGLPRRVVPWYPLVSLPFRFARHGVTRLLPNGRERLIRSGRAAQVALVERQFGREIQAMGALRPA
jgi:hypothetical protein